MYTSLKAWINVPYTFLPFVKYNGAGTKIYNDPVKSLCYPVGDIKTVIDVNGVDVVSTATLYVDGTESIKDTDTVIFEGRERAILKISNFYRKGKVDIRVVYL